MKFISESQSSALITHELAFEAISAALVAAASLESHVFPAVIAHGSARENRFSVKAGATDVVAGVKMGFYWPSNKTRGIPSHNSVIVLIDQEIGGIAAVIEAGVVNAYRTSAADAVATHRLARADARVLTIFGAGNQAGYECLALARVRSLTHVNVVNRDAEEARAFVERLASHGLKAVITDARQGCEQADIIVTATPSQAPLFDPAWVRPGTHISTMGADSKGKQEVPVELLQRAKLFCDLPEQSLRIGELQHVAGHIERGAQTVTPIGLVITGQADGRTSDEDVTVFDSSGIALQDLYIGRCILEQASATA